MFDSVQLCRVHFTVTKCHIYMSLSYNNPGLPYINVSAPLKCARPSPLPHSRLYVSGNYIGASAIYLCDRGYSFLSSHNNNIKSSYCTEQATWSWTNGRCIGSVHVLYITPDLSQYLGIYILQY